MQIPKQKYYPTTIEAIHLLVLYVFLQSLVDFPLALYDYNNDTQILNNIWIGATSTILITFFIFFYGYKRAQSPFKQVFALRGFNPLYLLPAIIMLPGMQFLVDIVNRKIEMLIPTPPWFWELFDRIFNNRFGFWGSVVKVAVIAPIIEEVLFRGIIMFGLMRNYKPWFAILMSGVLFSVFHLNPWQMPYTFLLGLLLGWLMVKTKSLPLCILVHAINNLIVLLSIVLHQKYPEHAIFSIPYNNGLIYSILAVISGIVFIYLLSFSRKKKK